MTARFVFASARITGHDPDGKPLSSAVLDLSAHGTVEAVPDAESRCGERFDIRLALAELPELPPSTEPWGHDLLLWSPNAGPVFTRYREVWLHRVSLRAITTGRPDCVGLSGPAWGCTFHLETEPPVPSDTTPTPGWITQPADTTAAGS
jgi:hypothetical protein